MRSRLLLIACMLITNLISLSCMLTYCPITRWGRAMRSSQLFLMFFLLGICSRTISSYAQQGTKLPPIDHFSLDQIDHNVDPCMNFYQYTCKKWIATNPIPSDQAFWGPDGK